MTRVVALLLVVALAGCDTSAPASSGPTPPPIPSGGHLPTAPVDPPSTAPDTPRLDAFPPLPSPPPDGPTQSPQDGAAGFSDQHGGWAQHGPGGAVCWAYGLNLVSSMVRWPGYVGSFIITTGGASKTYLAEFMWYQGWIGWRDGNGQMQYRAGVALGAYEELDSAEPITYAWINNNWQQTAILANTNSGYYGYGSNVPIPASGTYWTWIYHYWGPINEGTPERPGPQVFTGGGHLDYLGSYQC